ncbi:hypothetical protein NE865_07793 [Phthorimaea operculella]|nr:hypothetical protein NE865_07793 [Phthorimaea operculella]
MGKEKSVYLVQGVDLIALITGNIPKGTNVTLTKVHDLEMSPDGVYFEPEDDLNGPHLEFVKNDTRHDAEVKKPDATMDISNKGKLFATKTLL